MVCSAPCLPRYGRGAALAGMVVHARACVGCPIHPSIHPSIHNTYWDITRTTIPPLALPALCSGRTCWIRWSASQTSTSARGAS